MTKIATAVVAAAFVVGLCGCSSTSNSPSAKTPSPSKPASTASTSVDGSVKLDDKDIAGFLKGVWAMSPRGIDRAAQYVVPESAADDFRLRVGWSERASELDGYPHEKGKVAVADGKATVCTRIGSARETCRSYTDFAHRDGLIADFLVDGEKITRLIDKPPTKTVPGIGDVTLLSANRITKLVDNPNQASMLLRVEPSAPSPYTTLIGYDTQYAWGGMAPVSPSYSPWAQMVPGQESYVILQFDNGFLGGTLNVQLLQLSDGDSGNHEKSGTVSFKVPKAS